MPFKLITATSVVPPPMSTSRLPLGSKMSMPAPNAAAMGSSMRYTFRAPAARAVSTTARRSTSVVTLGMQMTIRGLMTKLPQTCLINSLIISSVSLWLLMTPSFNGFSATMYSGVLPSIS